MPVRHVLVVDDSKSARLMLRKMLQGFNVTVDAAETAEEALNYLRSQQPDAIFLDHTMPGMDGLAALRQIRGNPLTAAIPVAMYTSKDDADYLEQAIKTGAIGVLSKPATPELLDALLKQMDAATHATQPAAVPAAPSSEGVSSEWVEKLLLEKSELVFYDMVESQVLPLINSVIAKLRRELELNHEEVATRVATDICETRLAQWQPPAVEESAPAQLSEEAIRAILVAQLGERLETFGRESRADIEGMVQDVAGRVCQTQLHELSEHLVRQLSARFTEATQKTLIVAREAAIEAAREEISTTVAEAVTTAIAAARAEEKSVAAAAAHATHQLWTEMQRDLQRRMYLTAGAAAVVGIGAAVLVYGIR